jgi:hypothetical protein
MTTTTEHNGRLGNQIIRNLSVSLIAEKNDLYVDYSSYQLIKDLGIDLFVGTNKYDETILLTDDNYISILESLSVTSNLDPNHNYFQTKEITNVLYNYLQGDNIKTNIINKNPFKDRYNANNDLCIHIRLTDMAQFNPGLNYYLSAISNVHFDKLYITTDEIEHPIVRQIIHLFPNNIVLVCNEIITLQFSSTCKHIILSPGSFSAIIGYLSFFSNVQCMGSYPNRMQFGDMFNINGWKILNSP